MNNWCIEVWGDYACFTRPEMKVERVSYDLMTPSSARGIFEAILWKPAIRWHITSIEVLNPIKWVSVRRNEVGRKISVPSAKQLSTNHVELNCMFIEEERQQRAGLFLKDVRYRINGYFEFMHPEDRLGVSTGSGIWADEQESARYKQSDENPAKYAAMFERRAKKGQCFHRPYLGCREFACNFKLVDPRQDFAESINETRDLGFMLYDLDFNRNHEDPMPLFFRAQMENGVVNTDRRVIEVRG